MNYICEKGWTTIQQLAAQESVMVLKEKPVGKQNRDLRTLLVVLHRCHERYVVVV